MDCCTFDSLLTGIGALSGLQCTRLLTALTERVAPAGAADIIQAAMASKLACPRCQGRCLYRHGEANGLQRFRCRDCGRTFNSLTGSALFDSMSEENFFDVDEAPAEEKKLFYARKSELGNGDVQVMGVTSEFVLQSVLPGLSADAKYCDQSHFMQVAGAQFRAFWRQD